MPWSSPTPPRDNSKMDALNKSKAETTIRKVKEKAETKRIVREVGTGSKEISELCLIMNSIDEVIKKEGIPMNKKVHSLRDHVELALNLDFKVNNQSQNYAEALSVFSTMKGYFKRLDNALKSSAESYLKINYAKNIYIQFDDKYRDLFKD
ncbi:hypothetical protein HZA97_07670 [Candidatus Woesearchaeota archaeon]|nr:hypothetical protein [Candidatus Woesearchaeota archaeon]